MSLYTLALFTHIVGALVLAAALGAERVNWGQLRRAADARQARAGLATATRLSQVGLAAMLALFGSGGYLMFTTWGPRPWLHAALLSTLPMAVLGIAVTGRGLSALKRTLARAGAALPASFFTEQRLRALVLSTDARAAIVLAIVFLMTSKPAAGTSFLTLAVTALAAAVALGWSRVSAT